MCKKPKNFGACLAKSAKNGCLTNKHLLNLTIIQVFKCRNYLLEAVLSILKPAFGQPKFS